MRTIRRTTKRMGGTLVAAALALALPASASAFEIEVAGPVVPGEPQTITVTGLLPSTGVTLTTEYAGARARHLTRQSLGEATTDAEGTVRIDVAWPRHYPDCAPSGGCEQRPYFAGQRVEVTVCTVPVETGDANHGLSSIACANTGATVARAHAAAGVRFRNRWSNLLQHTPRWIRLERDDSRAILGLRWSGWGTAEARATGTLVVRRHGARIPRRGSVVLTGLTDCGGHVAYTTIVSGGRTRALTPCAGPRSR